MCGEAVINLLNEQITEVVLVVAMVNDLFCMKVIVCMSGGLQSVPGCRGMLEAG